jgi:hypothetical protein
LYKNKESDLKKELFAARSTMNRKEADFVALQLQEAKISKEKAAFKIQVDALILDKANAVKERERSANRSKFPPQSPGPNFMSPPVTGRTSGVDFKLNKQLQDAMIQITSVCLSLLLMGS